MSDLFLVEAAVPFLRELAGVRKWFFIRYGEGGPHIRIRLDVDNRLVADAAHAYWKEQAPKYLDGSVPGPEWRGRGEKMFEPGSVQRIKYEAEIARYGGPLVIPANERLFCRSTMLALGIVAATLDDFERRIGQAVKIMVASAQVISDDRRVIGDMFLRYAAGWERFLTSVGWTPEAQPIAVVDPDAIRKAFATVDVGSRSYSDVWRAGLAELVKELEAPESRPLTASKDDVVLSQVHMFCNRLGISPALEFHLASQIGNVLS